MQCSHSDMFTKGFTITKEEMEIWLWSFEILRDLTEEMTWDVCLCGVRCSVNGFGRGHIPRRNSMCRDSVCGCSERMSHLMCRRTAGMGMAAENAHVTWTTTHRITLLLLHAALKSCSLPPVECSTARQCSYSSNLLSRVNSTSAFLLT